MEVVESWSSRLPAGPWWGVPTESKKVGREEVMHSVQSLEDPHVLACFATVHQASDQVGGPADVNLEP
jgi:hypothetical protein